jgi:predicted DNA-binding transcriptional regulator AlpA
MNAELMLTREGRELLRVSKTKWDRLAKRPDFPRPIRLGTRSLRWKRTELLAWAEEKRA